MMRWYQDGWWGMPMFFGIGPLLTLVLVGALVYYLVRLNRQSAGGEGDASARDILDRRFARGEITREQYEQMKKDLLGAPRAGG